jgi:hypothetical protein
MKWLWRILLLLSLIGLSWTLPFVRDFEELAPESTFTPAVITQALVFFICLVYAAGYLGGLVARWFADSFVDLIYDSGQKWSPPPPPEAPPKEEAAADPKPHG